MQSTAQGHRTGTRASCLSRVPPGLDSKKGPTECPSNGPLIFLCHSPPDNSTKLLREFYDSCFACEKPKCVQEETCGSETVSPLGQEAKPVSFPTCIPPVCQVSVYLYM